MNSFYSAFLNIHRSGVLTALAWLVPQESAARESQSRRILCTPYNHAPCHFMQSHICKVYACLAVTCHLRFWQDDWGLLRATAVTRGWNGYRNKSRHRKLTLEKKILPPLQQGFKPATFRSLLLKIKVIIKEQHEEYSLKLLVEKMKVYLLTVTGVKLIFVNIVMLVLLW